MRCYTNRKLNDLDWNSVLYSLPTKKLLLLYLPYSTCKARNRKEGSSWAKKDSNEQWTMEIHTPFMKLNFINSTYKNIFCDFILNRINIQKYFNLNRGKNCFANSRQKAKNLKTVWDYFNKQSDSFWNRILFYLFYWMFLRSNTLEWCRNKEQVR